MEIETKWETTPLGEICEVFIGGTPSRKNPHYFTGNNLWVSIGEMNGEIITDTKEKITDEGIKKSNVKLIPKGTTLLSFKLSIGKTAIAGNNLYTNEAIAGLIPKNKNKILDLFLFHLFTAKQIDLENTGWKAFGKSLNSAYLKDEVKIPLPPLDVQKKIIDECEAINAEAIQAKNIISKCKNEIDNKISNIIEKNNMNNITNLKIEIIDGDRGENYPKSRDFFDKGFCIFLNASNIVNNEFRFDKCDFITKEKDNLLRSGKLKRNDIVITTRGTIGKVAFYHDKILHDNIRLNSGMIIIRNQDLDIDTVYLYQILKSFFLYEQYLKLKSGASQPQLPIREFKKIKIPVPAIEIQKKVVSEIEKLEQKINEAQKIIDEASNKKKAVMKKYL